MRPCGHKRDPFVLKGPRLAEIVTPAFIQHPRSLPVVLGADCGAGTQRGVQGQASTLRPWRMWPPTEAGSPSATCFI